MQARNKLSLYLAEGLQLTATCGTNHSFFTNPLYKNQSAGFQGDPWLLSSSLPCSCANCVHLLSESCPFSLQMASSEAALLCMLASAWLDGICQWSVVLDSYMMFTHVFLKIKKNQVQAMTFSLISPISTVHLLWLIFVWLLSGNQRPGPSLFLVSVMLTSALSDLGCPQRSKCKHLVHCSYNLVRFIMPHNSICQSLLKRFYLISQ